MVNELHEVSDIEAVAQMIAGAQRYFLQNFVETGDLLSPGASFTGVGKEKLQAMLEAARKYVPAAEIRGTAMWEMKVFFVECVVLLCGNF